MRSGPGFSLEGLLHDQVTSEFTTKASGHWAIENKVHYVRDTTLMALI